jgi:E3 ubiquitin-protein ligase DOA10
LTLVVDTILGNLTTALQNEDLAEISQQSTTITLLFICGIPVFFLMLILLRPLTTKIQVNPLFIQLLTVQRKRIQGQ